MSESEQTKSDPHSAGLAVMPVCPYCNEKMEIVTSMDIYGISAHWDCSCNEDDLIANAAVCRPYGT